MAKSLHVTHTRITFELSNFVSLCFYLVVQTCVRVLFILLMHISKQSALFV